MTQLSLHMVRTIESFKATLIVKGVCTSPLSMFIYEGYPEEKILLEDMHPLKWECNSVSRINTECYSYIHLVRRLLCNTAVSVLVLYVLTGAMRCDHCFVCW